MTTAVLDPVAEKAEARHELFEGLRELVTRGDVPELLDDLSRLLGRARRRINKATKAASKPSTPAPAAAVPTAARPAPAVAEPPRVRPAVIPVQQPRVVTLPIPAATPERHGTSRERSATPSGVPMSTALTPPRPRRAWRLLAGAVLVALVVLVVILLAGCGGGTKVSNAPSVAAPAASKGAPNAPTVSACRALVTNEDIARMRHAIDGTADVLFFQADKAALAIFDLRTPGGDVNVDPSVAGAMRTASEQAQAIRKRADYATNFDRQAWVAMIAGVDVACKLAGVDMAAPR